MNPSISLFVLAAGMGSRYGGLKQMEGFGPSGETLIDYSIYDAMRAGFEKVVFVIRPDMKNAFDEIFVSKYKDRIDIQYVFQSVDKLPEWYKLNPERTKPWGTAHALLMAKDIVNEPCLIINGDDFYGRKSFEISSEFLREECSEKTYGITTYKLKNVLSDNGTVKRGVCKEKDGYLLGIEETFEIGREGDGRIYGMTLNKDRVLLEGENDISMNMFAVYPTVFLNLEERFNIFLKENENSLTDEFLLPKVFNDMIVSKDVGFKLLRSSGEWFGVTYREDAEVVRGKLNDLIERGEYPEKLF